jgi:hypothetical protein
MGKETYTSESREIGKENERVDLRKHKKRITTYEEKQYILDTRKKYKDNDLRSKMARVSKYLKEDGRL